MKYFCSLRVGCDIAQVKDIIKIFEPEDKALSNGRGQYSIGESKEGVIFKLEAKDATALRALTNSIAKTLILVEKSWSL